MKSVHSALIATLVSSVCIVGLPVAADQDVTRGVETLGPIGAHTVWVPDRLFAHSRLYDGDTGGVLAIVDSAGKLTPTPPMHAPTRNEIYSVDVDYSRGRRGDRIDYVTILDATTLRVTGEVLLPNPTAESNTSIAHTALLDGERFLLTYTQFPETVVTIVDLESRTIAGVVPIAGCAGIYPAGPSRFATLCGDGTTTLVVLDENGAHLRTERSEVFFDVVEDPVAMAGARLGDDWVFISFAGQVHRINYAGERPVTALPWPLADPNERAAGWRPGGLQHVTIHSESNTLFVVMHEGQAGSHKDAGPEIWRFDLTSGARLGRFETSNLTADLFGQMAGLEPGGWADWLLHLVLDTPGVHSIAVTQDESPVLFARNAELGIVAVLDPETGDLLRNLEEAGITGPTLGVR